MQFISLIIPAKDEMESLETTLREIFSYRFINEVIIVVDSYKDNSISIAKKFNTKVVVQKKKGFGSAIIEGFNHAKNKYACIFNADYSFNPKYLKRMIKKTNKYQFIFGTRYMQNGSSDDDTIITFIGNKIFTYLSKKLLKIKLSDVLLTYVLCNVTAFKKLNLKSYDFRICIELPAKVQKNNYYYKELGIKERKRFAGIKKVNVIKDGFLISCEIIKNFMENNK